MLKLLISAGIILCLALIHVTEAKERILFGNTDTKRLHKHHVSILAYEPGSKEPELVCGGGILSKLYVLTAAHCVYGRPSSKLLVQSGYLDEKEGVDYRVHHKVAKYMHPALYQNSTGRHYESDIAILRLVRTIDLSDDTVNQKLQLPEWDTDYEDAQVVFAGHGAEKIDIIMNKSTNKTKAEFQYAKNLRYFESKVIPLEECRKVMPMVINDESICTEAENSSGFSCLKDSGGILVHNGVAIGIRNRVTECTDELPELFTRVSKQLSFILNVFNYKYSLDIKYVKN